jgi:hypothetical protein
LNEKSGGQLGLTSPKMKKKLTFELVVAEIQLHQTPKLPQGFGDASYERAKNRWKQVGQWALTTTKK